MPQIDKTTFLFIVFWTFILYVFQYLIIHTSHFYKFFSLLKLTNKRILFIYFKNEYCRINSTTILSLPWFFIDKN